MTLKAVLFSIILVLLTQATSANDLVVGVFENKPITYYDEDKAQGLYVDVLDNIAAMEGWNITYKSCNFSECLDELKTGKIDLLPAIAKTDSLEETLSFSSIPLFTFWGVVYTHTNTSINTFTELNNKRVGVIKDTVIANSFYDYCNSVGIKPTLLYYQSYAELFNSISSNETTFIVANNIHDAAALKTYNIKRTGLFFSPSTALFATRKDQHLNILSTIDNYMKDWIIDEGSPYSVALHKWFSKLPIQQKYPKYGVKEVIPYLVLFVAIVAILLLFTTKFGGKLNTTAYSIVFFIWTALIASSLGYNHTRIHNIIEHTALLEAQNIFEKDLLLRSWITNYGGLPNSNMTTHKKETHANVKECLNGSTSNPLFNPSVVMRYSYTTLKNFDEAGVTLDTHKAASSARILGFNTKDQPELWENKLLESIKEGKKIESYYVDDNTFRYIHTIYAVEGCKVCHKQFKDGELVGALSVSLPMDHMHDLADSKMIVDLYCHAAVYIIGLFGIFLALRSNELRQQDLQKASIRLIENEKKYKDLFMNAPLAYQSLGIHGELLDVNNAWLELLGYKKEEVQKRNILDFVDKRYHTYINEQLPKLKKVGYLSGIEYILNKADGTPVWVSVSGRVGYDNNGNFKQTHCVITDISERKQAEEETKLLSQRKEILLELSQMEERDEASIFAFVAESISKLCDSSISYVSLVNSDEDKITQVAYNGKAMSECSRSDKLNVTYNLDKCGVWADCLRTREAIFINDYPNYINKRGLPEGHVPITNHMNVPVFDGNNIVAIFGVGNKNHGDYNNKDVDHLLSLADNVWRIIQRKRNIIKTLRLEKQLREAQKMEAIGTLSGGLSHDFNNILQIILGYSDLIMLEINNEKTPKKEYIQAIVEAANKGARLTGQLRYFSEKERSFKEPISLNRSVESTVELMKRTIPKMINIDYSLEKDLYPIMADVGQIEQVIMNLAINAVHAMPDGGDLNIITCNTHIGAGHTEFKEGTYVVLTVSDTGCGIPQENISKIFNPFFTTKKQTTGGSGLGLYVVYGIVKNHSGYITCDSVVDQGTTFCIYLPADRTAVIKPPTAVITVTDYTEGNETILVVDDEEFLTDLTENYLTTQGYNVILAKNGEEALDIYKKTFKIDLVILDLNMPGMGGIACLKKLLEYDPKAKVIIASGYSDAGPIGETKTMGALGYLNKPFTLTDLAVLIRHVLDR
ncbi:MAG TPA: response regulator [Patescibacteria group bacterium]|nr:response regulator [Patescibacteria group bacterium]